MMDFNLSDIIRVDLFVAPLGLPDGLPDSPLINPILHCFLLFILLFFVVIYKLLILGLHALDVGDNES